MRVIALTSLACALAMSAASACTSFGTEDGGGGTNADGGDERSAPPVGDGAVEAARDQDSPRFMTSCTGVDATLCDDFDHGEPLGKRWRLTAPDNGASMDISVAHARSAPASFRVLQPAENASFGALLTAELPTFVGTFSMSFDILFVEKPTGAGFLVETHLTPKSSDQDKNNVVGPHLAAYPVKEGVELRAWNWQSSDGLGEPIGLVTVGEWAHVTMSFAPASTGMALTTYAIDGLPMTRVVPSEGAVLSPSLALGARSGGSHTNIHYDNIVIDAH